MLNAAKSSIVNRQSSRQRIRRQHKKHHQPLDHLGQGNGQAIDAVHGLRANRECGEKEGRKEHTHRMQPP